MILKEKGLNFKVNFSIIPLYFGKRAKVYTIQFQANELNAYEQFVLDNMLVVPDAVRTLDKQLRQISTKYGIIDDQFKRESPQSHQVYRIEDTEDWLRIFCIKYSRVAIVLGGGGLKDELKVKLDENPELLKVRDILMQIEDQIHEKVISKEIKITDNGFEGDLVFKSED